jgi:hypothetical protein
VGPETNSPSPAQRHNRRRGQKQIPTSDFGADAHFHIRLFRYVEVGGATTFLPFGLAGGPSIPHIIDVAVTLPIGRMSREDKLRAMEALWADLSRDEAETDSPGWHGVTLRETEQLVRDGKAKFSDWQSARRRVRRKAGRMA